MASADILHLAESGRAEDLQLELRTRALSSLYFFAKVVCGYDKMVDTLHLEWCNWLTDETLAKDILKRGILAPRAHFKSTVMKAYLLWRLCPAICDEYEFTDPLVRLYHPGPEHRIALIGESDTVAKKNLNDIKWNLTQNELFKWLFPTIVPDTKVVKWTDTEIELPRKKSFDEPTIMSIGIGAKTTGFHFDTMAYDDPIGEKAAKSEAEMEKAWNWFAYAPGMQNDPETCEEVFAGTRWKHGTADIYGKIMAQMPEGHVSEDGKVRGFSWYIRSAIENNEPIFPERFTLDTLASIRNREGEYKFNCQYQNTPSTPEGADFPESWLKEFSIQKGPDGRLDMIVPDDGTKPVQLKQLIRVSFLDPSSGGKSANCENAIAIVGQSADRRKFVLDVWSLNCGYGTAIEKWHALNDKYLCFYNYYELVGAQKSIEDIFKERKAQLVCRQCQGKHRKFTPMPEKPLGGSVAKEDRIRLYAQGDFEAGMVYIRRGLAKLRKQIIEFPHGDMVDQFDAVAYGLRKVFPPRDEIAMEEKRKDEEAKRQAHQPRCAGSANYGGYA